MSGLADKAIFDIIRYEEGYYIHKQVEKRNGMLFMRIKKRSIE